MKIFGYELKRVRAQDMGASAQPVWGGGWGGGGWFSVLSEGFSGAFQSATVTPDSRQAILAFSAAYSCVALIGADIGKLQLRIMNRVYGGNTWADFTSSTAEGQLLRKPNSFQTMSQFIENWVLTKLLYGNSYVLKERQRRGGPVTAMYVLDPRLVEPLVTHDGGVYYRLSRDNLAGLADAITVPASEVIHDRYTTLFHPLVGVSPISACAVSASVGNRIQANSHRFFRNMSRPSGMLTAPAIINEETAARLKREFEGNFSDGGYGRLFVAGDDLKYQGLTIPAQDAQLIEQLRWTVEDIARAFRVPLQMIGAAPTLARETVSTMEQSYYNRTLQFLIEGMEQCLDAGLELPAYRRTEFDLDGLLRMDPQSLYVALSQGVGGGWLSPNEARERVNLPPVDGGNSPYLQQQNYSLAALAKRDRAAAAPSSTGGASNGNGQ